VVVDCIVQLISCIQLGSLSSPVTYPVPLTLLDCHMPAIGTCPSRLGNTDFGPPRGVKTANHRGTPDSHDAVHLKCSLLIVHSFGGKMTTGSAIATKVRIATAASAIVAAATLVPAAVAYASPAAPLPQAGLGSTLDGDTVAPCNPAVDACASAEVSASGGAGTAIIQSPLFWFGPANPDFQPLIGITFPNFFGLDFEACILGAAIHLSPYGGGFIGLGAGC
jgi:hypothetical protein